MSDEIELKFEIKAEDIQPLSQFLNQWVSSDAAEFHLLGIGGLTKVTTTSRGKDKIQQLTLSNTYYDTPDYFLRTQRCGLRVRRTQDRDNTQYEITVKRSGNELAGLHERCEFNVSLPTAEPNLLVLPKGALPTSCNVAALQSQLLALFSTDFERQTWLISFANSEIEVALDQGEIKSQDGLTQIREIELELKQGNKTDLIHFALELSRFRLHLSSQSKAARGYRLLQKKPTKSIEFNGQQHQELSHLWQYWQQNEEYVLESGDIACFLRTVQHVFAVLENQQTSFSAELASWHRQFSDIVTCAEMSDITDFVYSEINSKLKLLVMLALMKNS